MYKIMVRKVSNNKWVTTKAYKNKNTYDKWHLTHIVENETYVVSYKYIKKVWVEFKSGKPT